MSNHEAFAIMIHAALNPGWAAVNWRTVAVARNVVDAIVSTTPRYERPDTDER